MTDIKDIDIVILCGGLGKRLRPKIGDFPKVMAQIEDKPFLDLLIEHFKCQGSRRIILCTGYQADTVEDYYQKSSSGIEIEFSRETEPLGTGGALKNAQSLIQSDLFVALNGDSFCDFCLQGLVDYHGQKQSLATIIVAGSSENKDFGSIVLDGENKVTEFCEKQPTDQKRYVSAGVYCFANDIFETMPSQKNFSLEYDLFPQLIKKSFYGFPIEKNFFDIGTPKRYQTFKENFKNKKEK